ncbi:hypothetical protein TIFTF001_019168 [Ficus carica]|uniref:Aminotransferase class V domain-containing protein n=1 Tax=Ficus carica TaxID=3494 RepID=A0AA88ACW9_FICCA|nr:hypothetical protein TIFTF001_019168 [Ficus carica]
MEDESVLYFCRHLEIEEGIEITYVSVGSEGVVNLEELKSSIRPDIGLVSNSVVNDKICVIQVMEEIGAICREDLVYGPKGIEALYLQSKGKAVRIKMQTSRREKENGIHSGFVPMPLVVDMGAACKLAKQEMDSDGERIWRSDSDFLTEFWQNSSTGLYMEA